MILDDIVAKKKQRLATLKKSQSIESMLTCIENSARNPVPFKNALDQKGLSIIAEIKKASPSKGLICKNFNPVKIAREYETGGAAAISVLTEEDFFLGKNEYLQQVKTAVSVPVLRKDFIIDPYQIYEARSIGSDAVLLIAAILSEKELEQFRMLAGELQLDALVEAHNEEELDKALGSGADIIGINNRNLYTFEVDLKITGRLRKRIPPGITVVSESGIHTREDFLYLEDQGVDAALIGESLMKTASIGQKLRELIGKGDEHGQN